MFVRPVVVCASLLVLVALPIPSPAHANEKIKVAVAFGTLWTSAQPKFCSDRGEFGKAGLDVELITTRGGSETVQAVLAGGADIGYGPGANAVIAAIVGGSNLKIISGYFNGENDSFFYVLNDSPIKKAEDLNGKAVAFTRPGSVSEQILLQLKKDRHIDFKTVSTGTFDAGFTMTATRQIDVGYATPPAVVDAIDKNQVRVVFTGDEIPSLRGITSRVTMARGDFIKSRRDVAAKFLHVLSTCIDWMYANPGQASKMFASLNGVSEAVAVRSMKFYPRESMQFWPIVGFSSSLQDAIDMKFIDKMPTEAEIKNMIDLVEPAKK